MIHVSYAALIGNPPMKLWTIKRLSQGCVVRHSANVRSGSKADMAAHPADVRYSPKSRHC
jgi:hypothetical protein